MIFSKFRSGLSTACILAVAGCWTFLALPASAQEPEQQQAPAESAQPSFPDQTQSPSEAAPEQAAPAESEAPAAEPPQESTAPADAGTPPTDSGAAEAPAAPPEQPAAEAPAAPAESGGAISASQVQIGAPVFGADGAKIGEVNGVKSDDSGKIQEILVTDGVPAGMNAKVFEISADKITSVGEDVKLSLSSEEAKKLPIIDNSNG